ncbi:MAG: hypothetical protein HW378_4057 [Anaerolineales bacterium]|nr:hypothetical protein [Anaerolineales bacterium]
MKIVSMPVMLSAVSPRSTGKRSISTPMQRPFAQSDTPKTACYGGGGTRIASSLGMSTGTLSTDTFTELALIHPCS